MNRLRIYTLALIGFGNAGKAFARLLEQKSRELEEEYNARIIVTAIVTGSHGFMVDENGIDLRKALSGDGFSTDGHNGNQALNVIRTSDYDIMCELTPLNIMTGEPAITHIREAFARGKHVITANKGPVAWAYKRLKAEAEAKGVEFCHETTVMDGTPVFNLADYTLRMCRVTGITGILNSTTNYVMEEMAAGKAYDEIIAEGQRRGFIEADPAMDIEGYDAAAKLTALVNVLMGADMTPDMIDRKGIEDITPEDIKAADAEGKVIKLVCRAKASDNSVYSKDITAQVRPERVSRKDILATITGTTSVVSIETDLMGTISVVEHEPEIEQTAYGIFSDMLRIIG